MLQNIMRIQKGSSLRKRSGRALLFVATFMAASMCFLSPVMVPVLFPPGNHICNTKGISFGIFLGDSVESLQPVDLLGVQGIAAWPIANPVFSAATNIRGFDGISSPSLWVHDDRLLMFFEATSCRENRRAIGIAESFDEGASWRLIGTVLGSHRDDALRRPNSAFVYDGKVFILTDSSAGPKVYAASAFPNDWHFNSTLIERPIRGPSIYRDPSSDKNEWILTGSVPSKDPRRLEDDAVVVYSAPSPLGPWEQVKNSPFTLRAGSPGGGISMIVAKTSDGESQTAPVLVRAGRSCHRGRCGDVHVAPFNFNVSGSAMHDSPQLAEFLGPKLWKQKSSWDKAGRGFVSVVRLPSGKVAAVSEGRRLSAQRQGRPMVAVLLDALVALFLFCAVMLSSFVFACAIVRVCAARSIANWLQYRYIRCVGQKFCFWPSVSRSSDRRHQTDGTKTRKLISRLCKTSTRRVVVVALFAFIVSEAAWELFKIRSITAPFWGPAAAPEVVGGQFSRFTLMVMTYEARKNLLGWYIRHYSECPSVGEILIVWNAGKPPRPEVEFPYAAVPVRVRVETVNSMNNRYRVDHSNLRYRAVLSLDDDILLPCGDVERAFATWRERPELIVGWYPRFFYADIMREKGVWKKRMTYLGEPEAIDRGKYNLVLTGAAFFDARRPLGAYWAPALTEARDMVDQLRNCDDLLMNFVVANLTLRDKGAGSGGLAPQVVQYLRPTRRLDLSHFSGAGLSHEVQHFVEDAETCLLKFSQIFGGLDLRPEAFDWSGSEVPTCTARRDVLQCSYTSG